MIAVRTKPRIAPEHPVFAGWTYAHVARMAKENQRIAKREYCGIRPIEAYPYFALSYGLSPLLATEVSFYRVEGERWTPDPNLRISLFPYHLGEGNGDIVPIAGGIYIGEKKLTDQELARAGLHAVVDNHGRKISYPYLGSDGHRSVIDLFSRSIHIFGRAVDRGQQYAIFPAKLSPSLLTAVEEIERYVGLAELEGIKAEDIGRKMIDLAISRWKYYWENQLHSNTFDKLYSQFNTALMLIALTGFLKKHGFAYSIMSPCLQFKGVGSDYYGRAVYLNPDGSLPLRSGETVLTREEIRDYHGPRRYIGFSSLLGKHGIFLDQPHQPPPSSPDPIGGMLGHDCRAIEIDRLLLESGGCLAGISFSAIRILSQEKIRNILGLTGYDSGDLFELGRAVCSDTRRLHFLQEPAAYKNYVLNVYDKDFEKGRAKHLRILSGTIATNIRAILGCRLSTRTLVYPAFEGYALEHYTINNLDYTGAIYDSAELVPVPDIKECGRVIHYWLKDLMSVVEKGAGLDPKAYILSRSFHNILLNTIFEDGVVFKFNHAQGKGMSVDEITERLSLFITQTWQKAHA